MSALQAGSAEETLRLIASLPAPDGLVERLQSGLHAAPQTGKVVPWPVARQSDSRNWLRSAAAAALVCVVAGGAWQISSHMAPASSAAAGPERMLHPGGGFTSAGAMRTPGTLKAPVLRHEARKKQKPELEHEPGRPVAASSDAPETATKQ